MIEAHKPSEFENILTAVENNEKPYKYIIIDTISKLDAWSEIVGTYNYMNKPQGQKFNRDGREMILHTDSRFETVHQLPNGFGYQHSRQQMVNWYERICALSSNIILLAHIKDKMIESKTGDSVEAIDLDLTGKVKNIYASRADAIGYFYRKGNQGILNFNNEYKVICGGRCAHLNGEIVISEKNEKGDIITHWNKIYI